MANLPAPTTYVTGQIVTSAELNADIRDSINFLIAPPHCQTTRATSTTWPSGTSPTQMGVMGSVLVNNDLTITVAGRAQVNTAGLYEFTFRIHGGYTGDTTGTYAAFICLNSGGVLSNANLLVGSSNFPSRNTSFGTECACDIEYTMNVGDYVECFFTNTAPTALPIGTGIFNSEFSATWKSAL